MLIELLVLVSVHVRVLSIRDRDKAADPNLYPAVLYVWAMSYLALPYTPIGEVLSSAHMIHYAALAPFWLKLTIKAPLAAAASYHTWNGFRHLGWDMGYCEWSSYH